MLEKVDLLMVLGALILQKTEEEVDDVLNRTIMVFRFLHEKDVFERYYKGHLAKRLLQARSVSDDAERGMMAKLKIECGHGYVQKLQGMLNDMKVSEETLTAFDESLQRSGKVSVRMQGCPRNANVC